MENVPSSPLALLQLLVLNLNSSEPHLVNERLAVVRPSLYHTRATFQAVLMINSKQTLPFSHSFPQCQIKVFYEGEIEKTDTPFSQVTMAQSILSQRENVFRTYVDNLFNQSTPGLIKCVCLDVSDSYEPNNTIFSV